MKPSSLPQKSLNFLPSEVESLKFKLLRGEFKESLDFQGFACMHKFVWVPVRIMGKGGVRC